MEAIRDGILAFLAAVGLSALMWMLAGFFFRREKCSLRGLRLLLPLRGEAEGLEAQMQELRQVQSSHPGAEIVLLDCGLTSDARLLANYLAEREEHAKLVRWRVETKETGEGKSHGDGADLL